VFFWSIGFSKEILAKIMSSNIPFLGSTEFYSNPVISNFQWNLKEAGIQDCQCSMKQRILDTNAGKQLS
jgi:hypothetical protein